MPTHRYNWKGILMEPRINYATSAPGALNAMLSLSKSLHESGLDESLLNLVFLRASQINGCAYCIDMHWKDLRAAGADEQKLYMLDGWHEWPGYNERERAALEWTEAVTLLSKDRVPDEVYHRARKQFDESELAWLTLAVVTINGWNRLNVAFRVPGGSYQPPSKTRKAGG
jgi:AhpD family alkylhydroperoxidase